MLYIFVAIRLYLTYVQTQLMLLKSL